MGCLKRTEEDWVLIRELELRLAVGLRAMQRGEVEVTTSELVTRAIASIHMDNNFVDNPEKRLESRQRRRRLLSQGLCADCGRHPHRPRRTTCQQCYEKQRERREYHRRSKSKQRKCENGNQVQVL